MPKTWTLKECFELYGTVPKNPRWSWSARSPEGQPNTVAMTFWQEGFEEQGRVYRSKKRELDNEPPGRKDLFENLKWAVDHCGGELRVIITIPKDKTEVPRQIRECFPQEKLRMRIVHLDDDSFVTERIEPANA